MSRQSGRVGRVATAAVVMVGAVVSASGAEEPATGLLFHEVSAELGLDFRHQHGGTGEYYMIETMGSGLVLFDYDGDGDDDVFFVDSGHSGPGRAAGSLSRLFRNDGGLFVDRSPQSGIVVSSYGMGGAAGDVDGDGDLDLYVTGFGRNQLYLNRGDGVFVDAGESAGVDDASWSSSAAFADFDRDGDLDLYVSNYVDFAYDHNQICGLKDRGVRSYCHPDVYQGLADHLFCNRGSGAFDDCTEQAGLGSARGAGLGVVWIDVDGDGWLDLYVANDMNANFLFHNLGNGKFEETGLFSGAALSDRGSPEAGMGIAVGDADGDGREDLVVTHLDRQSNAAYASMGGGLFADRRYVWLLAEASLPRVGFGAAFSDLDLDGDLDLVVANGHIIPNVEELGRGGTFKQANDVFENQGSAFAQRPGALAEQVDRASRGLAVSDLDLDGDLDVVISNSNDHCEVWRNDSARHGDFLTVVPVQPNVPGNLWAVGARVALRGKRSQGLWVRAGSSYQSQSSMAVTFGVTEAARELEVSWPNGGATVVVDPPTGRRLLLSRSSRQGTP